MGRGDPVEGERAIHVLGDPAVFLVEDFVVWGKQVIHELQQTITKYDPDSLMDHVSGCFGQYIIRSSLNLEMVHQFFYKQTGLKSQVVC